MLSRAFGRRVRAVNPRGVTPDRRHADAWRRLPPPLAFVVASFRRAPMPSLVRLLTER